MLPFVGTWFLRHLGTSMFAAGGKRPSGVKNDKKKLP